MSLPLVISPCTPSDAPELARAQHTIFQSPIYRTIYAAVPLEAQLAKFSQTIATGLAEQTHPTRGREVSWLKCVHPATDEIVAYVNWIYMPSGYRGEDDHQAQVTDLPDGTNAPVIEEFYRVARLMRAEHPGRRGPHYLLSLLGTLPTFERQGAASRLIRRGLERADEMGVPAYVDSSPTGLKLYEKMGFRQCGEMKVDLSRFEGVEGKGERLGVQRWVAMRREPVKREGGADAGDDD